MKNGNRWWKTLHVRLPDADLAALEQTAARLGLTKSDIVRRALYVALPCFDGIQLPTREDHDANAVR